MAEHSAVNRAVVGSSPTVPAKFVSDASVVYSDQSEDKPDRRYEATRVLNPLASAVTLEASDPPAAQTDTGV